MVTTTPDEDPPRPYSSSSSAAQQPLHHTYIAGEDEGRLASMAQSLGVDQARLPSKVMSTWSELLFRDDTYTAATMHSVGQIGANERVDHYGTLQIRSLRKRRTKHNRHDRKLQQQHQRLQRRVDSSKALTDLFQVLGEQDDDEKITSSSSSIPQKEQATTTNKEALQLDQERGDKMEDEEEEEEEEEEEYIVEGGSLGAAAFGIIKGTVGPAILYLPRGLYASGWLVAVPAMMFATGMFILNAYRLLDCWKVESDRNHRVETQLKEVQALLQNATPLAATTGVGGPEQQKMQQYGAAAIEQDHLFTVKSKMLTYPELAKRALGKYAVLVELGIALFQFGVCLTYLIFVPDNLHQCALALGMTWSNKFVWLAIMIVIEIPLSWIKDIRRLTPTNVFASFLIAFGLCAVLVIAVQQGLQWNINEETGGEELALIQNIRTMKPLTESWFMFIGTSFFMMEGSITLLVPLQEAVYRPEDRAQFPDMNRNVTSWIVVFYIVFSFIACAAFGSHIHTALTASLQGTLAAIVQMAYSIAVILTFPLQAFPAMEVAIRMMHQITGHQQPPSHVVVPPGSVDWKRNAFATTIVLLLGVIGMTAIDYLGNVVSILGSLFGIPLALIFPPLMHNALVKDSISSTRLLNYGIVLVGIFAMGAASFNTIVTWDSTAERS